MYDNILNRFNISIKQFLKYGLVGVFQNVVGYCVYLFLTWVGIDPIIVVAICYPLGMYISFLGNKKYTFRASDSKRQGKIIRYLISHIIAYTINISSLYFFSDVLGYSHQVVQFFCIIIIAFFLFFSFKYFVFARNDAD